MLEIPILTPGLPLRMCAKILNRGSWVASVMVLLCMPRRVGFPLCAIEIVARSLRPHRTFGIRTLVSRAMSFPGHLIIVGIWP